jgi:nitrate/nitrite transporter NarK
MLRNIFERRFGLTELEASSSAAYPLSGSVVLYPLCGTIVDRVKRGSIVVQLMTVASTLTFALFLLDGHAPECNPYSVAGHYLFWNGDGFCM